MKTKLKTTLGVVGIVAIVISSLILAGVLSNTPLSSPEVEIPFDDEEFLPPDATWISPGKVHVGNYYPGARAEWPLTIYNSKDVEATFSVLYRYPDFVTEGYDKPPLEAGDWISICTDYEHTVTLKPQETRDVLVALVMPSDVIIESKKWEFWVGVTEVGRGGLVMTELAVRWLVRMR